MKYFLRLLFLLLVPFALVSAACGSDSDDTGDEAEESSADSDDAQSDETTPGLDPEFVEQFQTQLSEVGCYDGPVDGIDGPATTAAIVNFQRAQGLGEDGVVGSETETALLDAVEAGAQVCFPEDDGSDADDGDGAMDGAEDGPAVSVESAQYDKEFAVTSCDNPSESTVTLTAEADDVVLDVEATDGAGTLSISGGSEQDGIDLAGTVTSVAVGDAGDVTIEGTFDSGGGEAFTVTGSCS